jgi:hypothetical protein
MPIYQIDIEKTLSNEYWTNVYHVNVADALTAQDRATSIYQIEREVHMTFVLFTKYRVAPYPQVAVQGFVNPIGLNGLYAIEATLPLFNVARVDFGNGVGRPSRKYLRLPVGETMQQDAVFSSGYRTSFNNAYSIPLLSVPGLCDTQGRPLISAGLMLTVGMRQLRRGSKRRLQPII